MTLEIKRNDVAKIRRLVDLKIDAGLELLGKQMVETARAQLRPGHGVDTGAMRASLHYVRRGDEVTLVNPKDYGQYNEYGTRFRAPAPHMRPAAEAAMKEIPVVVKGAFKAL